MKKIGGKINENSKEEKKKIVKKTGKKKVAKKKIKLTVKIQPKRKRIVKKSNVIAIENEINVKKDDYQQETKQPKIVFEKPGDSASDTFSLMAVSKTWFGK